jgi:hypothetical protein
LDCVQPAAAFASQPAASSCWGYSRSTFLPEERTEVLDYNFIHKIKPSHESTQQNRGLHFHGLSVIAQATTDPSSVPAAAKEKERA